MSQSIEDLMKMGLSKAEAERVVNRQTKAAEKAASSKALAEKRLPKAQAELDHATARQAHWAKAVEVAQAKVAKHKAIIAGESTDEVPEESTEEPAEEPTPEAAPAPAKKASSRKRS